MQNRTSWHHRRAIPRGTVSALLAIFLITLMTACESGGSTALPIGAEGVRLDRTNLEIDEGASSQLRVLIGGASGQTREVGSGAQVVWLVRDPEIATVVGGLVTGIRPGSTRITVTVDGKQTAHADVVVLPVPGALELITGDRQAGIVGLPLTTPIRLRVLNRQGLPMSGVQVAFRPLEFSGSVSPTGATLDADGSAELVWTLGPRSGPQVIDIVLAGRDRLVGAVTAEAAPGPVARVQVTPMDALTTPGGLVRYSAAPLDEFGNVVPGAQLEWHVVDPTVAEIGADGVARAIGLGETVIEAIYRSDPSTGAAQGGNVAQAPKENRGQGYLRSQKNAGIPSQVTDLRTTSVSSTSITLSFTQVGDGSGGAADYQMRFTPTPIGSGFGSAPTASAGTCKSPIQGSAIGATLTCVVEGLESNRSYDFQVVAFREVSGADPVFGPESNVATGVTTAALGPASLEIIGGNNQVGAPGALLSSPLTVRVKDATGTPMANVSVHWTVTSGGGSLSRAESSTNSLGVTEVQWTLGSATGAQGVRVTVGALAASFAASAQSASVASITITPGSARVTKGQSLQLAAEARDAQGRTLSGTVFTWYSSDPSKATVSSSGQVTGLATGNATVHAAVSGVEGDAAITVEDATTAPAWVEILGGSDQTGNTGSQLAEPLRVRVRNTYGQGMANVPVTWTVTLGGGALSAAQTVTDAQGVTEVRWTLGPTLGTQTARAAAGSVASSFEATAQAGSGSTSRPAPVTTLTADSAGSDRIYVHFTEVDDGTGHPADYSLRYHVSPIGWNWGSAVAASVGTCADLQGTGIGATRRCWVGGLQSGVRYDIQVVASRTDAGGTVYSENLSNVATATTLASGSGTLSISPRSVTLQALGATQQVSVTARDASGATLSNPGVSWSSSNTSIATIDSNGMLTARGVGTVLITAVAACCASDQITVTVQPTVASLSVSPSATNISRGQDFRLTATARDANGNVINGVGVSWQSSNAGVVTVRTDGTVHGENQGSANVTASAGGQSAAAAVSVTEAPQNSDPTWPNEPSGMTLISADDWQAAGTWQNLGGSDDVWTGNGWTRKTHDVNIVSVGGLPTGTSRALEIRTPAGTVGGYGPWAYHNYETSREKWGSGGYREIYFGYWTRMSTDFEGHPSGSNKHANIIGRTPTGNKDSFWAMPWGGGVRSDFDLRFDASAGITIANTTGQCSHSVASSAHVFRPGQWQRVELWYRKPLSTGAAGEWKVWVDGVLVMERNDVCDYGFDSSSYLQGVGFHGTWGGVLSVLSHDNVQHFGPYRVSGRTPK